jgi:hypothetical protein
MAQDWTDLVAELEGVSALTWMVIPGRLEGMEMPPMFVGRLKFVERSIPREVGMLRLCGMLRSERDKSTAFPAGARGAGVCRGKVGGMKESA